MSGGTAELSLEPWGKPNHGPSDTDVTPTPPPPGTHRRATLRGKEVRVLRWGDWAGSSGRARCRHKGPQIQREEKEDAVMQDHPLRNENRLQKPAKPAQRTSLEPPEGTGPCQHLFFAH